MSAQKTEIHAPPPPKPLARFPYPIMAVGAGEPLAGTPWGAGRTSGGSGAPDTSWGRGSWRTLWAGAAAGAPEGRGGGTCRPSGGIFFCERKKVHLASSKSNFLTFRSLDPSRPARLACPCQPAGKPMERFDKSGKKDIARSVEFGGAFASFRAVGPVAEPGVSIRHPRVRHGLGPWGDCCCCWLDMRGVPRPPPPRPARPQSPNELVEVDGDPGTEKRLLCGLKKDRLSRKFMNISVLFFWNIGFAFY